MAGLLAAEHAAFALQRLEDVAVADVGRHNADSALRHEPVEAEVRHLRDGDEVDAEVEREHGDDRVTVDRLAPLVHGQHAVAVAVEGDPEVAALPRHNLLQARARSVAPQPTLMFVAVGLVADGDHLGAELLERGGAIAEYAPFAQSTASLRPERSLPNRSTTWRT